MKLVVPFLLICMVWYAYEPQQPPTLNNILYSPYLIKWNESHAYCLMRRTYPSLCKQIRSGIKDDVKCMMKKLITALHAAALRLLLILAGDVEENPGPKQLDQTKNCSHPRKLCSECDQTFTRNSDLLRHIKAKDRKQNFTCDTCNFQTNRKDSLKRHMLGMHPTSKKPRMDLILNTSNKGLEDEVRAVLNDMVTTVSNGSSKKKNALKGEIKLYRISRSTERRDVETFLNEVANEIEGYVNQELATRTGVKLLINPHIQMFKPVHPEETTKVYFSHKPVEVFRESIILDAISSTFPAILKAIDEFTREGSGWAIHTVYGVDVHLARLGLMKGSSYQKLPKELFRKKAIINVKNKDKKCFMWSILAKLYPAANHPHRISNYILFENELDFMGIEFPVKVKDIPKVEKRNGLAVNLYGYDDEVGIHPLRISKEINYKWIHLLLYQGHYSLIKNLDSLLFDQRGDKGRKYFCPRCLTPKYSNEDRQAHYDACCKEDPTKIIMPLESELKFTNYKKMLRQPLVLYADFECLTEKVERANRGNVKAYQNHVPCGYGLVGVTGCCRETKIESPTVYRGEDCVKRFFTEIAGKAVEHQEIINMHQDYRTITMTPSDWIIHRGSICHICNHEITWQANPGDEIKVRDHCHFCGQYRGAAHRRCNREYRKNRDIVVVMHNLRKYDAHLLMQEIGGAARLYGWELDVIAKTMEDYISFSLIHKKEKEEKKGADELGDELDITDHAYKIKFIDSFQFMNRSLAELVGNLDKQKFYAMMQAFSEDKVALLLRKGVYPYDYMDSWQKFDEYGLPIKREFYNKLNDEDITDEDYRHATEVWKIFNIQNLGQYHDLYLKTDIMLLADVFEEFRGISMASYGLDPCHYMTAPSLTFDACLKMTGVTLELLQDPDIYMFFEHGIRGGISQISHRYAKANNKYLEDDPSKPSTYIMYLDANNLYGYAMVQSMPIGEFQWMDKNEIEKITWLDVPDDYDTGYVLEVDLEYPAELHDSHASYPLAPEHMAIAEVSPYCKLLKEKLNLKTPPTRKLLTTLFNKEKYIIHYRNLKLYLSLGIRLARIHRVISFKQAKWMEPYIISNTQKRTLARNGFEKDFYKLMNNAAFGKTMEDVQKYKNVELVISDVRHRKLAANPRYQSSTIFTEDLVGVCSLRSSTCLNKPIYCGFTVLELSKELMYQFHYQYIVPKYDLKAKLLFTDTDSLCYLIETKDIYEDMFEDSHLFDFSDYPKNHALYSTTNKKVIGKMKDETAGMPTVEFCGLRSKMYSVLELAKEKKTAKGIKKMVVKKVITHQDYVNALFTQTSMSHNMNLIQSYNHQLETVTLTKKSLSPYDDKRWLLDSVNSVPYGHYSIS